MQALQLLRQLGSLNRVVAAPTAAVTAGLQHITLPFMVDPRALLHTSASCCAARKGTRARREAVKRANKRKKIETEVKKDFVPYAKQLELAKKGTVTPRRDYSKLEPAINDVYVHWKHCWKVYSVAEAIQAHRETHHPTQYNLPNALVYAYVELSLLLNKKNRYLPDVTGVLMVPHEFRSATARSVAVITDDAQHRLAVQQLGADLVGGKEVIKMILNSEVDMSRYDYIVTSVDMLPEFVTVRGILKKSFPTPKAGTAVVNVVAAADKFINGLKYTAERDKYDLDFAHILAPIGTLDMAEEQLEANLVALLKNVETHRTARKTKDLITLVRLKCPPTGEQFLVDHALLMGTKKETEQEEPELEIQSSAN